MNGVKVERKSRGRVETASLPSAAAAAAADGDEFRAQVLSAGKRRADEEADQLLARVEELGAQLIKRPALPAVEMYRDAVRRFVALVVNRGLGLLASSVRERSRIKVYAVVREIDARLLELLEAALAEGKEPLRILALVGEIKGLLISLRL